MTGGDRVDGLEHVAVIGKLDCVRCRARRVRERHAVGTGTLNIHAIGHSVAIVDSVHDLTAACTLKINDLHRVVATPLIPVVRVVVKQGAVLGLNRHGLALLSWEGKRKVVHGGLQSLHGSSHLGALDVAVVGGVTSGLDGSVQLGHGIGVEVGRIQRISSGDECIACRVKIGDGDVCYAVIANDGALTGLYGKRNRELLVAIGSRAGNDATGLDINLFLSLAFCEGDLLRRSVEVVLDSGAGLGLNNKRYRTLGAAGTTDGKGVSAVLVHGDVGLGEVEHAGAIVIQIGGSIDADGTRSLNDDVMRTSVERIGLKKQRRNRANGVVRIDRLGRTAVDGDGERAVVGVLGTHDGKLGAREAKGSRGARLRGPHARALKAAVDLLGVPVAGLGHLGVIDTGHALGQRGRLLKTAGCLEQANLGNLRKANVLVAKVVGVELDLDSRGGHRSAADQALGANRAAAAKIGPRAVALLVRHRKAGDALAVLDGLLDGDDIECRGRGQLDGKRLIGSALGAPVRIVLAVQNLGGTVILVVVPGAAGLGRSGNTAVVVSTRQVVLERILDVLAKLANAVGNGGIELALIVGRHVQQQRSAVADRLEIHIAQLGERLRRILGRTPEPTGGNASIGLGNEPLIAIGEALAVATAQIGVKTVVGAGIDLARTPGGVVRKAVLVADPTDTCKGTALKDQAILGLELLDGVVPALEVIDLGIGTGTLGAIHPDLNELAVVAVLLIAQDLPELTIVIVVVVDLGIGRGTDTRILAIGIAVRSIVDIPGREI